MRDNPSWFPMKSSSTTIAFCGIVAATIAAQAWATPARWISGGTDAPESPAPILYRSFNLDTLPTKAVFDVAVAGWCEVRVNGKKAGQDVLSPVTCQPDKRISSIGTDVTSLLKTGENTIEVVLGNSRKRLG